MNMPESELSPIEKIRQAKAEKAKLEAEAVAKLEAEKAASEVKEARRGELSFEREQAAAGQTAAEQAAGTAKAEADEARTIQSEMGTDIDADTAKAFEAIFAAEFKANADLESLNADLARIDEEIKMLESGTVMEADAETPLQKENKYQELTGKERVLEVLDAYDLDQEHTPDGHGAVEFVNMVGDLSVEDAANMDVASLNEIKKKLEQALQGAGKHASATSAIAARTVLSRAESRILRGQNRIEENESPEDRGKDGLQDEFTKKYAAEYENNLRPKIIEGLVSEGKLDEGDVSIPRETIRQLIDGKLKRFASTGSIDSLLEASYLDSRINLGGNTLLDTISNLRPEVFSGKLPELKTKLLTVEQQRQLGDIMNEEYGKAKERQAKGAKLRNWETNAIAYVEGTME